MIDFEADLKELVIKELEYFKIKYSKKDDLFKLLIRYFTFRNKYIIPQKRKVYISSELAAKLLQLPLDTQESLEKMYNWVNEGIDINCFQGRGLYGQGSRDYQNMLYGIVHLHLSANKKDVIPVVKKDGFAKAGRYLLFALFKEAEAYFIDIVPHPSSLTVENIETEWTSAKVIKIIESNWPSLLDNTCIKGASLCDGNGEIIEQTDYDIAALTAHHITTFIQGKEGLYFTNFGVTTSGDSTMAVMSAQKFINNARRYQLWYTENEVQIQDTFYLMLKNNGQIVPEKYDIHLDYMSCLNRQVILDRKSGVGIDPTDGNVYLFMLENGAIRN